MSGRPTIACVIGTRPEAIKMAPVIAALRAAGWARCMVVATAQHRGLLDQMLDRFAITVDHDLDLMTEGQAPADLVARMMPSLDAVLAGEAVDAVLAQGDTTTVLVAALVAFHRRIPFGHVEAGLRTGDFSRPFPEEGYRQMVARIAHWHFAPTAGAADNLRAEGIREDRIHVTGNTGIDTLLDTVRRLAPPAMPDGRLLLLTAHRRESFGPPMRDIFGAVCDLVERHADVTVLYPVHPNPEVGACARELLAGHARITLLPPQDYFDFVALMREATLVLTDSGGIQEEAPALGKPVLVLREQTERPEAVAAGVARIIGTRREAIVEAAGRLLDDPREYRAMARGVSPYGDGHAAGRIERILRQSLRALQPSPD